MKDKKILFLAPHTDDCELGCGASIARFVEEGARIFVAIFSCCEESVPVGFEKNILKKESINAIQKLGVNLENMCFFEYKVRYFKQFRQEILENMINLRKQINPDVVFLPNTYDVHQDHQVISEEGIRAFKNISILGYEMPWNNIVFRATMCVKLKKRHIDKKIDALSAYNSQQNIRKYMNKKFIESLARVRGVQSNTEFAEAFEVIKWII